MKLLDSCTSDVAVDSKNGALDEVQGFGLRVYGGRFTIGLRARAGLWFI